uniref:RNA-directed DNA polymerase n=1 Tax=Meloidogyne enterolobii TaxID=390850 RepID=A0A6V7X7L1_MELEN|nr:unnamed protein product [Meloidogyne enterolobii]
MSDFDETFFTPQESKQFSAILIRLRAFEKSVAQSMRRIEGRLETLETNSEKTKNSMTGIKGSITRLRNNVQSEFKKLGERQAENASLEDFEEAIEQNLEGNESDPEDNSDVDLEVKVMDPFLNNGQYIGSYDGNPSMSFSKWIEKFKDVLSLISTPITEEQKLTRLRFCLAGQARTVLDTMNPVPTSLEIAINNLRAKFENGNTKVIARQKLSSCRQAPGESVFEYANRLSDLVRTALVGENENTVNNTLLYEFLDKLSPELKFQVKTQRPPDYGSAYELASHLELLLAEKKPTNSNVCVSSLADEVEALVLQRNNRTQTCFQCKSSNHLVRNCPEKRYEPNYRNGDERFRNNFNSFRGNFKGNGYENRNRNEYTSRPNYGDNQNYSGYRNYPDRYGASHNRNYQNRNGYKGYPDSRSPSRERNTRDFRRPLNNYYNENSRNYGSERRGFQRNYTSPHRSPRRVRFERGNSPSIRTASPYYVAVIEPVEEKIMEPLKELKEKRVNKIKNKLPHKNPVSVRSKNKNFVKMNSPYMIVFLALLACFFPVALTAPMICLRDAPVSLWRLPTDPICPSRHITEAPVPINLTIYRANTLQYKTPAYVCKCIKTTVSKSRGVFGAYLEESGTEHVNVPISACKRMRELNNSIAGDLREKNGSLKATENDPNMEWKIWPFGIPWDTKTTENCYVYESVVFTHFGTDEINTPIGVCPGCLYHSGSCKCDQGSLIWHPDKTQQCSYVFVDNWAGEYSSGIWLSESNEFALSFENATKLIDCEQRELILSDQGFAIPLDEFKELQRIKDFFEFSPSRVKREIINEPTGIVYSSQLASQLSALSASLNKSIKKLFSDSIRQICQRLQELSDQLMTLAAANPTLLARHFLKKDHITARLVTENVLEIKPCYIIKEENIHFNWKNGICFDRLPISFVLHGSMKHGFIDTSTLIIYPHAKEVECETVRWMYLHEKDRTLQFDQVTGDQKEIAGEGIREIIRYGKLDIPEMSISVFRNKILANLTELYSPEHFSETMESAKITQEIARLSNPNSIWETSNTRKHVIAGNIVSNGLFSFLKGGIFSINQVWVFACCCYITLEFIFKFILPSLLTRLLENLNIGEIIINSVTKARRDRRINKLEKERNDEKESRKEILPLSERWPSQKEVRVKADKTNGKNFKNKAVEVVLLEKHTCDKNMRIFAEINGKRILCLIDTGAHVSLISKKTAKSCKIKSLYQPDFGGVYGIGNNMVPLVGQADIKIKLADCEVNSKIMIIDQEVSRGSYEAILGRETLKDLPLCLNFLNWELININEVKTLNKLRETSDKKNEQENTLRQNIYSKIEFTCPKNLRRFKEFLERNITAFSLHDYDLGKCKIMAPPIITTSNIPIQVKPFRTPEKYREELKFHINSMLESGVLVESMTPWANNLVLVQKGDGKLRPCVDFRPLNTITVTDPYPLPKMEEVIHKVSGKVWYSSLDLASGFWQIPLDKESSYKCGIITEWGLYEMRRLPFGLKNAPSIFQRTMDKILKGVRNVTVYIDDILIHTKDFESHIEALEEVCCRLKESGLKLKGEKCKFFMKECIYLGHEISSRGYKPAQSNSRAIKMFPRPKNVKEVKRFLGMTSFFRKFILNFATIAAPLNKLTRGSEQKFIWKKEEEEAFEKLKNELNKSPCLRAPNYNRPFHLFCDASSIAYAGALMQTENDRDLYSIGYCSRTLTPQESKLPATHNELAAIYYAISYFKPVIYGGKLTIYTDHRPLTFLFSKASTNVKLNRWLLALQEIEPCVVYIEGSANKVADALSRAPISWKNVIPHRGRIFLI